MGEGGDDVVLSNVKFKVFSKLIAFASFSFMGQNYLQIHFMEKILNVFQLVQTGDCADDHRGEWWHRATASSLTAEVPSPAFPFEMSCCRG